MCYEWDPITIELDILRRMQMPKRKNIDYTDIPETDEEFWSNAKISMPKRKRMIT